ncbi:MAG: choice-of-anchor U domain-containing protein [bacterium]
MKRYIFMLIFFFICFSVTKSAAQSNINLALVGHLTADYGYFHGLRISQSKKTGEYYAFCATSLGMVTINTNTGSIVSFLPLGTCYNIEISPQNADNSLYAYVDKGKRGIDIINIDDPQKPYFISTYDPPGTVENLKVYEEYVYVASGDNGFQIIDTTNKSAPLLVGSYPIPGFSRDVVIMEDYAFVATTDNGVQVIDISNKGAPVIVGACLVPGVINDMALRGDYLFVGCSISSSDSSVFIIDVSNKSEPQIVGSTHLLGTIWNILISGDYIFVSHHISTNSWVQVMAVDSENIPVIVGSCIIPGEIRDSTIGHDSLFLANDEGALYTVDMSIKNGPLTIGGIYALGDTRNIQDARAINIEGNDAYVADGENGLRIVDMSSNTRPIVIGGCYIPGHAHDVVIHGDYAYVAMEETGVQIVDIHNKTALSIVSVYYTPGASHGLDIIEEKVFIADGENGVVILDISDPSFPLYKGGIDTKGFARKVVVSGNYAYVADGENGVVIIDISDPAVPAFVGECDTSGDAYGVAVVEDFIFVADGDAGMHIIDAHKKYEPVIIGSCHTFHTAMTVSVTGQHACVADGSGGVQIIDISDKTAPITTGNCGTSGYAYDITIRGEYAYVADGYGGLKVVDITTTSGPLIVGHINTGDEATDIKIVGEYAYVCDYWDGLKIINIKSQGGPVIVGSYDTLNYAGTPGYANEVEVMGEYAYLACCYGGLQIIDITNKSKPIKVGSCAIPEWAHTVSVEGNYAFVKDGEGNLQVIDVSNKSAPIIVNTLAYGINTDIAIDGSYAYIAYLHKDLEIIDISNKNECVKVGSCDIPEGAYEVSIEGSYAFVKDGKGDLQIIDVSNKSVPVIIGTCDTLSGCVAEITINGTYAYISACWSGLEIVDISNKTHPLLIGSCDIPENAFGVAVDGNLAYVAASEEGIQIIDITNKSGPVVVGESSSAPYPEQITVQGNFAYITADMDGMIVMDISNKSAPVIVGNCPVPGGANKVSVHETHAFVTNENTLHIIDISTKSMLMIEGSFSIPEGPYDIALDDNYAYVLDKANNFQVIDIGDVGDLRLVGSCSILRDSVDGQLGVAVEGEYAYIAAYEEGVQVIDISDKSAPVIVGNCKTDLRATDIALSGDYAIVTYYNKGFFITNIRDKRNPEIVGIYNNPVWSNIVYGMAIEGDYVYLAAQEGGMKIIDISNKSRPLEVGNCYIPKGAYGIDISGDYALVLDGRGNMQIIDVKDHKGPMRDKIYSSLEGALGVVTDGNYAYVASDNSGLQVIDIKNQNGLTLVGSCVIPGSAFDVALDKDYVYVADGYSMQIIDISDKMTPVIVGQCPIPNWTEDIVIQGDYAYMTDMDSLHIIDISTKTRPVEIGVCETPGYATGIAVIEDYAYVADEDYLQVIDISNRSEPDIIGSCETFDWAENITIAGDYAYVVGGDSVQVVDISNRIEPEIVGYLDSFVWPLAVIVKGDYAYIVDAESLHVVDISDKSDPIIVASYETYGDAYDIALSGKYAIVADEFNGVLKIKIDDGLSPQGGLILVAGGDRDYEGPYWKATQALANTIFHSFTTQGFEVHNIYYLNPVYTQDTDFDGVANGLAVDDPTPTKEGDFEGLHYALCEWAVEENITTGPLYISLIGHGAEDRFQIIPNEVITAHELREWIDEFQEATDRQVVVMIEAGASGTFINDLIGEAITVITSTDDGASYIKPFIDQDETIPHDTPFYASFTKAFMDAYVLDHDTEATDLYEINSSLRDSFLSARASIEQWALQGLPFHDQAPQMLLPESRFISLHFSEEGNTPVQEEPLLLEQPTPYTFTLIGEDPNCVSLPLIHHDIAFSLSAPGILDDTVTEENKIIPHMDTYIDPYDIIWYTIFPKKNGIVTLTGYSEQNDTLCISAQLSIKVSIDDPAYAVDMEKKAIIVAGYKGTGDYLWESTNEIGNHVYQILHAMGYEKEEICYYNPYLLQDLDAKEGYDISGYPHLSLLDSQRIIPHPLKELLLFFVDHGTASAFFLNPRETLEVNTLVHFITEVADKVEGKIILVFDACYSGSFLMEIENAGLSDALAEKLIIISSTGPDQTAYFLNRGMVSFSRAFFDEWFLTHSILNAFDFAQHSLPLKGQNPRISNLCSIESWDAHKQYFADQSRPVIDEGAAYRSNGTLHVTARVYSLTGVKEAWVMIESLFTPLPSLYGEAITKAPEFYLVPSDPLNPYGGEYNLSVPDPCPNETGYILNIYALDNSKISKIASHKIALSDQTESTTQVLMITSDSHMFSHKEQEKFDNQIIRTRRILESKGLSENIRQIRHLHEISDITVTEESTFFIHMFGSVALDESGMPFFCLDSNERFSPFEFYATLRDVFQDSEGRLLILMDTPYAERFLSAGFDSDSWPEKWTAIASTDQGYLFSPLVSELNSPTTLYPCFSTFFFSGLLSGATAAQAYRGAENAVSLVRQKPAVFLPEAIESYHVLNRHLGYFLGESAIIGEDYTLFTECVAHFEAPEHYHLSFTSHPDAEISTAWAVVTSPQYPSQKSMIVDFDIQEGVSVDSQVLFEEEVSSGEKYYRASFMVEGYRKGEPDTTLTAFKEVPIAYSAPGIGHDMYEPDNDPEFVFSDTCHLLCVNAPPTRHTFYCMENSECDDRDWVYFYGHKGCIYEIYAQDLSVYDYFIRLSLYDQSIFNDPTNGFCIQGNNFLSFQCPEDGYYFLEAALASSYPQGGGEYILSIYNLEAQDITDILIHLIDPSKNGIEDLKVVCTRTKRELIELGNGFYHIAQIEMDSSPLILDVFLKNTYLATLSLTQLTPYSLNETEFLLDPSPKNYSAPQEDIYEPDNDPSFILFDTHHMIIINASPTRHTLYCEDDTGHDDHDWIFFYGFKDSLYEIYAEESPENNLYISLSLYDLTRNADPVTGFCLQGNNRLLFTCPCDGFYLLEARASSGSVQGEREYTLSINNPQAHDIADILLHLVDPDNKGVEGLKVIFCDSEKELMELGNGFYHSAQIDITSVPLHLEVYMKDSYLETIQIDTLNACSLNETRYALKFATLDSDGDFLFNGTEGEGDWDHDGEKDFEDQDTACFSPMFCLDIVEQGEEAFYEVRAVKEDSPEFPRELSSRALIPFDVVNFIIKGCEEGGSITIEIAYLTGLSSYPVFYVYDSPDDWEEISFNRREDIIRITLEDGGVGDSDGEPNGSINTFFMVTYPKSLGKDSEESGCFIENLVNSAHNMSKL